MKRNYAKAVIAVVSVGAAVTIGVLEPTRIVQGLILREAFYDWRPTSYWREVLRADGETAWLQDETAARFDHVTAKPVLRECLLDPDPVVRRAAMYLLFENGFLRDAKLAARNALDDPDPSVQFAGLDILSCLGLEAAPAVPRISELTSADDVVIATAARYALWAIDPERAAAAGNWKRRYVPEFQFSIEAPKGLTPDDMTTNLTPYGLSTTHSFTTPYGTAICTVAVTDYPPRTRKELTKQQRFEQARNTIEAALHGTLDHDEWTVENGVGSWDYTFEIDDGPTVRSRSFLIEDRLYQANITYAPGSIHTRAIDHFLNSFQIGYGATNAPVGATTPSQ